MASKRKKSRVCFAPETLERLVVEKENKLSKIRLAIGSLNEVDMTTVLDCDIDEESALALLAAKLSFAEVLILKIAMQHVPACYHMVPKGSSVCFRLLFISSILETKGISYTMDDLQHYVDYLSSNCKNFLHGKLAISATDFFNLSSTTFNRFLSPPVSSCLQCGDTLKMHNHPSKVVVYSLSGPLPSTKVTLECRACNIKYGISRYADAQGKHFYPKEHKSNVVEASNVTYLDAKLYKWLPALGNHCWVSFSGFSEAYNDVFFAEIQKLTSVDIQEITKDTDVEEENTNAENEKGNLPGELTSKTVSNSFFNKELEEELDERGTTEQWVFSNHASHLRGDEQDAMNYISDLRSRELYQHTCSQGCKKKGCGTLYVADGNWKLKYAHCMWKVPINITGFETQINYPDVCPLSPIRGKAFCGVHCEMANHASVPTGLREFLAYCKETVGNVGEGTYSVATSDLEKKLKQLKGIQQSTSIAKEINASTFQGTLEFIQSNGKFLEDCSEVLQSTCNKDTGGRKTLQSWSRGIFFVVSGGGNIEYWQPLYRSESPTQAFLITVLWLYRKFKPLVDSGTPHEKIEEEMKQTILAYDNMCHLDGMKVCQSDLPFPSPLCKVWKCITKVIDKLHIKNHKDEKCKTLYNPEGKISEGFNTMAAEQTFVWASRLKRIICAMPQIH